MSKIKIIVAIAILLTLSSHPTTCTHLKGTFKTKDFFKFLVKFGFQKTDRHHKEDTYGYIFGNITAKGDFPESITFAVLTKPYFLEYYQNRLTYDRNEACKHMFSKISTKAYDSECNPQGIDSLRKIPCKRGELCIDEDRPWNVVKGHQFTYAIQDLKQPS